MTIEWQHRGLPHMLLLDLMKDLMKDGMEEDDG